MTSLADKCEFARKHWTAPGGLPFEIDEDGWLYQEYWKPLHSFRAWPVDADRLCSGCASVAGRLFERYKDASKKCRRKSCAGLKAEPIQYVLLELPRQSGKTVGTSGLVGAALFKGWQDSVAFMAGSEGQSSDLFRTHYQDPITSNARLARRCRMVGNRIIVPKTGCEFAFLRTSLAGTTGGTKTLVVIDEARAVPADVAAALMPTIFAQNGWQCPNGLKGHTRTKGDLDDPDHPTHCATCKAELEPWCGRVLVMSSAGELDGGDKDWFHEACVLAEKEPQPRVHVFRAQGVINRKVSTSTVDQMASFWGRVDSMSDFIEIETQNVARRRGEDFLTAFEINRITDKALRNAESGERPGVAFLDTSTSNDLTSLVIVEQDNDEDTDAGEWENIAVRRIDIWDPAKQPGGVIDDRDLERALDEIVPMFKLLRLRVDDRHAGWVRRLVARLQQKPYGRIVTGSTKLQRADRMVAWNELERRAKSQTLRIPANETLIKELRAARVIYDLDNRRDVRERSRKKRHLDIAEALAGCCYDVHDLATRQGGAGLKRNSQADAVRAKMRRMMGRERGDPSAF